MLAAMAPLHAHDVVLDARAPFDFALSLRFVERFAPTSDEQHVGSGVLTRAIRVGDAPVLARLRARDDGGDGVLATLLSSEPLPAQAVAAAADRLGFMFSLSDDLATFYAVAADDTAMAPVIAALHGYHQVKFASPWENVVWAILAQRVPAVVARRAKAAIVAAVDDAIVDGGRTYAAFPSADQLAGWDEDAFRRHVPAGRKAAYLHGTTQLWRQVGEDFLRTAPDDRVREFLLSLPGIGPWSASFVLIRGLGRMDEVPTEAELLRAASRRYGVEVDAEQAVRIAEPYGRWRGYWAHYLRAADELRP